MMNLTRVLVILLVICVLNDVTDSKKSIGGKKKGLTTFKKALKLVSSIIEPVSTFCDAIGLVKDVVDFFTSSGEPNFSEELKQSHAETMEKLSEISNKIDTLSEIVKSGFDNIETIVEYSNSWHELSDALETINIRYQQSLELSNYTNKSSIHKDMLEDFVHNIFTGGNDIPFLLSKVHSLFFRPASSFFAKGFFEAFTKYYSQINYADRCAEKISPHQRGYYVFLSIMASEIKGLMTITNAYSMRLVLRETSKDSVEESFRGLKSLSAVRIKDYLNATKIAIEPLAKDIRRCDAWPPKRGETFVELERLFYIEFFSEDEVTRSECAGKCEDYNAPGLGGWQSWYFGPSVTYCYPTNFSSPRKYVWADVPIFDHFNHQSTCGHKDLEPCKTGTLENHHYLKREFIFENGQIIERNTIGKYECQVCAGKVASSYKINIHEQTSDITNNMIITGVRFVTFDKMLHIQIKQGKLCEEGHVEDNNEWEKVSVVPGEFGLIGNYHHDVLWNEYMYLNDVIVTTNYTVTGIKFDKTNDIVYTGYKLLVRGTVYDFDTGELKINQTQWFDPEDTMPPFDGRDKNLVGERDPDTPLYNRIYKPDEETNKYIRFVHTNFDKDCGQTTVPFFDAQPVTPYPAMPLNGIGLYYKGAKGFGGYIAPRIFTDPVDKYLDISDDDKHDDHLINVVLV